MQLIGNVLKRISQQDGKLQGISAAAVQMQVSIDLKGALWLKASHILGIIASFAPPHIDS